MIGEILERMRGRLRRSLHGRNPADALAKFRGAHALPLWHLLETVRFLLSLEDYVFRERAEARRELGYNPRRGVGMRAPSRRHFGCILGHERGGHVKRGHVREPHVVLESASTSIVAQPFRSRRKVKRTPGEPSKATGRRAFTVVARRGCVQPPANGGAIEAAHRRAGGGGPFGLGLAPPERVGARGRRCLGTPAEFAWDWGMAIGPGDDCPGGQRGGGWDTASHAGVWRCMQCRRGRWLRRGPGAAVGGDALPRPRCCALPVRRFSLEHRTWANTLA